jgi:hypothetical protein
MSEANALGAILHDGLDRTDLGRGDLSAAFLDYTPRPLNNYYSLLAPDLLSRTAAEPGPVNKL